MNSSEDSIEEGRDESSSVGVEGSLEGASRSGDVMVGDGVLLDGGGSFGWEVSSGSPSGASLEEEDEGVGIP